MADRQVQRIITGRDTAKREFDPLPWYGCALVLVLWGMVPESWIGRLEMLEHMCLGAAIGIVAAARTR